MDFEKLTPDDGRFETGAITSAISEADLKKIKLVLNEAIKDTGPSPTFLSWYQMTNLYAPLEKPSSNSR